MNMNAPLRESKQTERITFELKEMSPAEKRALWERYVNSLPRVLFNIFAPCLCLTNLEEELFPRCTGVFRFAAEEAFQLREIAQYLGSIYGKLGKAIQSDPVM